MPYSVEMGDAVAQVPEAVRAALRESLVEIAAMMAVLPPGRSEVNVLRGERMNLDLRGWRFQYVVEPEKQKVRVVDAHELR